MSALYELDFACGRSEYFLDPESVAPRAGDWCFAEGENGERLGHVLRRILPTNSLETKLNGQAAQACGQDTRSSGLRSLLRRAGEEELRLREERRNEERQAFKICRDQIAYRELPMKLVDVDYGKPGGPVTFYFTSENRVDFRELVRDLAAVFRTRIELRQIGVRDEAQRKPVIGICGKQSCCSGHCKSFDPITLRMARDQGLSLNTDRLGGVCGRLRCCLAYEMDFYREMRRRNPRLGSRVETSHGEGKVVGLDLFTEEVEIQLDWGETLRVPLSKIERGRFGPSLLRHPVSDKDKSRKT